MKRKIIIIAVMLLIFFRGVSAADEITSKEQLNVPGIKIGIDQGSLIEDAVKSEFPNAEILYFTDKFMGYEAVAQGKIDAFIYDCLQMEKSIRNGQRGVRLLDETMDEGLVIAVGISSVSNIPDLESKINAFIAEMRMNGTLDDMYRRWAIDGIETMPAVELPEDPQYHLVVGTTGIVPPYSYYLNNELNGYDIELAYRFAAWLGADLKFQIYDYGSIIPAAASGKIDCIMADLQADDERRENFIFSDTLFDEKDGIMVRSGTASVDAQTGGSGTVTLAQMDGKRIGTVTGSIAGPIVTDNLPHAEVFYFENVSDMLTALKSNKIDGMAWDDSIFRNLKLEGEPITMLSEYLMPIENAAIFPKTEKGQALADQYSDFVRGLWDDYTIAGYDAKWFDPDDSIKTVIDYENLPDTNGTLVMAVDPSMVPFTYVKDNRVVGYEVEIAAAFCEAYGYRLEILEVSFGSIIPALLSDKADFASSCITISPERAESVIFSEPVYKGGLAMAVLSEDGSGSSGTGGRNTPAGVYHSLDEFSGKNVGVQTGTTFDKDVLEAVPDAHILYFNSKTDLINALTSGKIEGFAVDEPVAEMLMLSQDQLTIIPEYMDTFSFAYVFPKDKEDTDVFDSFNEFLKRITEDGTLAKLERRWFDDIDFEKIIADYKSFPAPNGILRMATEAQYEPFSYMSDNNMIVGFDIDIAARFCEEYGYGLEITDMNFDSIISSVRSGKSDFGGGGIAVSAERSEEVLFTEPNYSGGTVMVVLRDQNRKEPEFHTFAEMNGRTVSMVTGAPFEELVRSKIPNVGGFSYFSSMPDIILALKNGKTDAALSNNAVSLLSVNRNPDALTLFPESLQDSMFGIAFAKGDPQRDVWQGAYDKIPEEVKKALWKKWTGADESMKMMPEQDWPGLNGTVQAAVCDTLEPMSYAGENGVLMGFDVEMILLMAKELDVHVEFTGMEFSAILASVQSGKALMGAGSIIITEERAEAVDFIPYYPASFVLVIRTASEEVQEKGPSFWDSVRSSFEKTFIRENRWMLILLGVRNTLLITVLSVLFGTALGFLLFMICRNGNPVTNGITNVCLWLVQGMPMVVLLMILFYIIFGSVAIDGIIVAIIGFTLTFGASVFGLLKMGVGAVDKGQNEASLALGYSDIRAFFRIILPQAIPHVMSAYKGEVNSLLKATAIVGYIAVQDLTKMGDIIRSRTYEAFFPLIAITVIYFLLEILLGSLLNNIQIRIDPKRRKPEKILKGVQTHDQN